MRHCGNRFAQKSSIALSRNQLRRKFDPGSIPQTPLSSKCSSGSENNQYLSVSCRTLPNRRSQQVRRISARREPFRAIWHWASAQPLPHNPRKQRKNPAAAGSGERFREGKWRTVRDSNPRDGSPPTHFPGVRLRPLGQLSVADRLSRQTALRKAQMRQSLEMRFCSSASWRRISVMSSGSDLAPVSGRAAPLSSSSISGPLLPGQPEYIARRKACC